ncbi:MAG: DUF2103 domain-containing protein [Candidatus Paceibacterota bacterium]
MSHLSGGKISGSHTTAIEAAVPVVDFFLGQASVKKLILGFIDNNAATGGGPVRIKAIHEQTGIEVSVSGSGANQKLRVYLDNSVEDPRQKLQQALETFATGGNYTLSFHDRR